MLASCSSIKVLGIAISLSETARLVGELRPDILLLDLHNLTPALLKTLALIHGEWPDLVIVGFELQESNAPKLVEYMRAGVTTCISFQTSCAAIVQALHAAIRGEALLQPAILCALLQHISTSSQPTPTPSVEVYKESVGLTKRELGILRRVALGERNKEIATSLNISEPTVKTHLANIYFKLGVDSRASAVAIAMERGLLTLRPQAL
ncbi:DNA-binding response regulator [Ktedonospora formicarum]|uniref:DNA-binding response regulator n=2 Tax=Ktedonospora formicarum TaxID=2778364 RepID=A0A8J3MTA3_9CHLR|nr:DNA-binding response regulator [Ktedonospora formicarum]